MKICKSLQILALLTTIGLTPALDAADWTGATDSDWGTTTNWDPQTVPDAPNAAIGFEDVVGSMTVTLDQDRAAGTVTFTNTAGNDYTIDGAFTLTLGDSVTTGYLYADGAGDVTIESNLVIEQVGAGALIRNQNGGTLTFQGDLGQTIGNRTVLSGGLMVLEGDAVGTKTLELQDGVDLRVLGTVASTRRIDMFNATLTIDPGANIGDSTSRLNIQSHATDHKIIRSATAGDISIDRDTIFWNVGNYNVTFGGAGTGDITFQELDRLSPGAALDTAFTVNLEVDSITATALTGFANLGANGVLNLTGVNGGKLVQSAGTYQWGGNLNLNAGGTMIINGTIGASATATVQVNDGGTLGGTGTILREVHVADGGTLSPGNSTGVLTIGDNVDNRDLVLSAGFVYDWEYDNGLVDRDLINLFGQLDFGTSNTAASMINLINLGSGTLQEGDILFSTTGGILGANDGDFLNWTVNGGAFVSQVDGNNIILAIPEPQVSVLLFGAMALGSLLRRRKR